MFSLEFSYNNVEKKYQWQKIMSEDMMRKYNDNNRVLKRYFEIVDMYNDGLFGQEIGILMVQKNEEKIPKKRRELQRKIDEIKDEYMKEYRIKNIGEEVSHEPKREAYVDEAIQKTYDKARKEIEEDRILQEEAEMIAKRAREKYPPNPNETAAFRLARVLADREKRDELDFQAVIGLVIIDEEPVYLDKELREYINKDDNLRLYEIDEEPVYLHPSLRQNIEQEDILSSGLYDIDEETIYLTDEIRSYIEDQDIRESGINEIDTTSTYIYDDLRSYIIERDFEDSILNEIDTDLLYIDDDLRSYINRQNETSFRSERRRWRKNRF